MSSKHKKPMKPWRGWCVVDAKGNHVSTPISTRMDVEADLAQWHTMGEKYQGHRIARVEVREITPKRIPLVPMPGVTTSTDHRPPKRVKIKSRKRRTKK